MTLYTIEMDHRRYQTTCEDKAWDFCLRFGGTIIEREPTSKIVDGVECLERTWEEIYMSIKRLCAPVIKGFKGHRVVDLEYENGFGSRVVVKPSPTGRYKIHEWPMDGE